MVGAIDLGEADDGFVEVDGVAAVVGEEVIGAEGERASGFDGFVVKVDEGTGDEESLAGLHAAEVEGRTESGRRRRWAGDFRVGKVPDASGEVEDELAGFRVGAMGGRGLKHFQGGEAGASDPGLEGGQEVGEQSGDIHIVCAKKGLEALAELFEGVASGVGSAAHRL